MRYESDAHRRDGEGAHRRLRTRLRKSLVAFLSGTPVTRYADALITAGFIDCACPLPADRDHRLLRQAAARLVEQVHVSSPSRNSPTPPMREAVADVYLQGKPAQRHDDGLRCIAPSTRSRPTRLFAAAEALRHAAARRQGDDGPQRAGGTHATPRKAATTKSRRVIGTLARSRPPRATPSRRVSAASSTPAQLGAGRRAAAPSSPACHLQSHISENRREIAWMAELFPERKQLSRHLRPLRRCSGRARSMATASSSTEGELQRVARDRRRRSPIARPRTCSSAAACST